MNQLTKNFSNTNGGMLDSLLAADSLSLSKKAKEKSRRLVFSECVWGIKNKEEFIFDPQKYGILDFMREDVCDEILSDTVIEYYSDGSRVVSPARTRFFSYKELYWHPRGYYRDEPGYWADMSQMLTLFPNDSYLKLLNEKYPYLQDIARFRVAKDMKTYELAMALYYTEKSVQDSFSSLLRYNFFSSLGNLQKFFKAFISLIKNENVDKWMGAQGITAKAGGVTGKCEIYAGFPDLTYHMVETILTRAGKSTENLKKVFLESGEPLNLTYGLTVFSGKDFNNFSYYNSKLGCPYKGRYMFRPEVFEAWGADFTPAELSVITRERFFYYCNPDCRVDYPKFYKTSERRVNIANKIKKFMNLWDL